MASNKLSITKRRYPIATPTTNPKVDVTIASTPYETEVIDGRIVVEGHITDPGVENKKD